MSESNAASSRDIALEVLLRIEDGAFAHILLPRTLRDSTLAPRDRALVTDLVYGTVRMQRALDALVVEGVEPRPSLPSTRPCVPRSGSVRTSC